MKARDRNTWTGNRKKRKRPEDLMLTGGSYTRNRNT